MAAPAITKSPRPRADCPRATFPGSPPNSKSGLVNGHYAQTRDLILHLQLAALQFNDLQIVNRRVLQRLGNLGLERLVPPHEFRKVRLDGHVGDLLGQIVSLTRKLWHEGSGLSTW